MTRTWWRTFLTHGVYICLKTVSKQSIYCTLWLDNNTLLTTDSSVSVIDYVLALQAHITVHIRVQTRTCKLKPITMYTLEFRNK